MPKRFFYLFVFVDFQNGRFRPILQFKNLEALNCLVLKFLQ